jgi:hypothetical protein
MIKSLTEMRHWAEGKSPDEIVGVSTMSGHCPMAYCHNELLGGEWAFDEEYAWQNNRQQQMLTTAHWRLLHLVDDSVPAETPITAAAFLAMIDAIEVQEATQ